MTTETLSKLNRTSIIKQRKEQLLTKIQEQRKAIEEFDLSRTRPNTSPFVNEEEEIYQYSELNDNLEAVL
jgi:hypothetical protein